MSEVVPKPDWKCWEGYINDQVLNIGKLVHLASVSLQTDAPTKKPETIFRVEMPSEAPWVTIEEEDGLPVGPPSVQIVGTCTSEGWHSRINSWPQDYHKGLIVPGEHILFAIRKRLQVEPNPLYLRSRVLGWKVLSQKGLRQ